MQDQSATDSMLSLKFGNSTSMQFNHALIFWSFIVSLEHGQGSHIKKFLAQRI